MEGLTEPLPREVHELLRRAVLDHVRSEHRRRFAPVLHVGSPVGAQGVFAVGPDERVDHALRTDVVAAMLRRTAVPGRAPLVWLTRSGDLDLEDVDAAWLAACRAAGAEAGLDPAVVVVTRRGWRDPRSGAGRTWQRLRAR